MLERSNEAFDILNRVHEDRPDYQGPVTNLDKWRTMIAAFRAFLQTVQDGVVGPFYDEFGNIKLQYTTGSDDWYSVDPTLLDNYDENDEGTIPEGFRLHIQTAHFPADGQPYMQTVMQSLQCSMPRFSRRRSEPT